MDSQFNVNILEDTMQNCKEACDKYIDDFGKIWDEVHNTINNLIGNVNEKKGFTGKAATGYMELYNKYFGSEVKQMVTENLNSFANVFSNIGNSFVDTNECLDVKLAESNRGNSTTNNTNSNS